MISKPEQRPAIGPILGATVITHSLELVLPAYAALGLHQTARAPWGRLPDEAGTGTDYRSAWLAVGNDEPWLRLVEMPDAITAPRYGRAGWFSLEVATNDVHALADIVGNAPGFETIAGPAPLDISEHIIAMQVAGPSGELYYFTEVQRELPPFDLYRPSRLLDRLFIAVSTVGSRDESLAFWQRWTGIEGLRFETQINILNRGLELAPDHRMPVATMQLAAGSLIEIDQLPAHCLRTTEENRSRYRGIAQISLQGNNNSHQVGPDAERIELCCL